MTTSGSIVTMHFCGEKLASWAISLQELEYESESTCCTPKSDHCEQSEVSSISCCKDNIISLKILEHYNINNYNISVVDIGLIPQTPFICWEQVSPLVECTNFLPPTHAPPGLWQDRPLYILFQQRKLFDKIG